jgi:hypothetical protein
MADNAVGLHLIRRLTFADGLALGFPDLRWRLDAARRGRTALDAVEPRFPEDGTLW